MQMGELLIWTVTWKTLMYALVALVVRYLERLYEYWKEAWLEGAHYRWVGFPICQTLFRY
jgi:hypothetical protein